MTDIKNQLTTRNAHTWMQQTFNMNMNYLETILWFWLYTGFIPHMLTHSFFINFLFKHTSHVALSWLFSLLTHNVWSAFRSSLASFCFLFAYVTSAYANLALIIIDVQVKQSHITFKHETIHNKQIIRFLYKNINICYKKIVWTTTVTEYLLTKWSEDSE